MRREIDKNAKQQLVTARLRFVLIEVREARGLTPYAVAQRAGLKLQAVLFIEDGVNGFKADTLERFAIAFDVFASELFAIAEWRAGVREQPPELAVRLGLAGARRHGTAGIRATEEVVKV